MKKNSKHGNSTKKNRMPLLATFHKLEQWYNAEFEKLGWMVLAKTKGYNENVTFYKNSLVRLKMAIELKLQHITDADKKDDLKILWDNLNILIKHVDHDF